MNKEQKTEEINKKWYQKSVGFKICFFVFLLIGLSSCDSSEVEDIDGKVYKTVEIGNQVWMAENLSVTKFRNGDPITEARTEREFESLYYQENKPAFVSRGSIADDKIYGKYYNWYAINDPRGLAPEGWHIPSIEEWNEMFNFLGGTNIAGAYLKSTSGWDKNGNGLNESGFTALPGGEMADGFWYVNQSGLWWTSTHQQIVLNYNSDRVIVNDVDYSIANGFTVRCIKNSGD